MDVARRSDGSWLIVELGDGQVAGLPENAAIPAFYESLISALSDGRCVGTRSASRANWTVISYFWPSPLCHSLCPGLGTGPGTGLGRDVSGCQLLNSQPISLAVMAIRLF